MLPRIRKINWDRPTDFEGALTLTFAHGGEAGAPRGGKEAAGSRRVCLGPSGEEQRRHVRALTGAEALSTTQTHPGWLWWATLILAVPAVSLLNTTRLFHARRLGSDRPLQKAQVSCCFSLFPRFPPPWMFHACWYPSGKHQHSVRKIRGYVLGFHVEAWRGQWIINISFWSSLRFFGSFQWTEKQQIVFEKTRRYKGSVQAACLIWLWVPCLHLWGRTSIRTTTALLKISNLLKQFQVFQQKAELHLLPLTSAAINRPAQSAGGRDPSVEACSVSWAPFMAPRPCLNMSEGPEGASTRSFRAATREEKETSHNNAHL